MRLDDGTEIDEIKLSMLTVHPFNLQGLHN